MTFQQEADERYAKSLPCEIVTELMVQEPEPEELLPELADLLALATTLSSVYE